MRGRENLVNRFATLRPHPSPVQQLLERHRYDEAFELFERSRSRALADLLASRKLGLSRPEEQKLYTELTVLRTQIADSQSRLFELASQPEVLP